MKTSKKSTEQGKRLETLTLYFKMSYRDIAALSGVSENTIYHINSGISEMSNRTAARICYSIEKKMGVMVNREWLLNGVGEMIDRELSAPYNAEDMPLPSPAPVPVASESMTEYNTDYKEKYYQLLEQYTSLQSRYLSLLESQRQ